MCGQYLFCLLVFSPAGMFLRLAKQCKPHTLGDRSGTIWSVCSCGSLAAYMTATASFSNQRGVAWIRLARRLAFLAASCGKWLATYRSILALFALGFLVFHSRKSLAASSGWVLRRAALASFMRSRPRRLALAAICFVRSGCSLHHFATLRRSVSLFLAMLLGYLNSDAWRCDAHHGMLAPILRS